MSSDELVGPCGSSKFFLVSAAIDFSFATGVALFSWRKSRIALATSDTGGTATDSKFVLLPAYQTILQIFVGMSLLTTLAALIEVFVVGDLNRAQSMAHAITVGIWNGVAGAFNDGITALLMQTCIGAATLRRIGGRVGLWGLIRGMEHAWWAYNGYTGTARWVSMADFIVRFTIYCAIWMCPWKRLNRRPALRSFVRIQSVFMFLNISAIWFIYYFSTTAGFLCAAFGMQFAYSVVTPIVMLHTLLMDGNYWRGLLDDEPITTDVTASQSQAAITPLSAPLLGISLTESAAASVAEQLDGGIVKAPRLNYAFLSLGQPKPGTTGVGNLLAAGGTARVYAGSYKGQPLAIKLIYCLELTPEIIYNFGRETNKLYSLGSNQHVVKLIGICVRPPSLAMALELCHYGSLFDVLERYYRPTSSVDHEQIDDSEGSDRSHRSILDDRYIRLDRRTRLIIALHVARGVAAMHSLHPALLHLDLKAQNFLVARRTDKINVSPHANKLKRLIKNSSEQKSPHGARTIVANENTELDDSVPFIVKIADLELSTHANDPNIRIPDTYQWTAPELLTGTINERKSRVSTSSDCFALGCVLYEIETGHIPYSMVTSNNDNMNSISARITGTAQLRPLPSDDNKGIDDALVQLMRQLWSATPSERPSAATVVTRLTAMALACPPS